MADKNSPTIKDDDVEKIANLSRIHLSQKEISKFSSELASILDYVEVMKDVDTDNVKYKFQTELENVFRKDKPTKQLSQDEALSNRKKQSTNGYFTIKSVLDKS